ncbi:MAG: argB [Acidimicrobiaceae bacterium]|nr:argB [Acidimicrobiaceae bacterium]
MAHASHRTATTGLDPETRAAVLVEAIPYIRRFAGQIVVVKYGGNALAGSKAATTPEQGQVRGSDVEEALARFAEDVVLMVSMGLRPVVVHGGGPQIGALMERLGKTPQFVDGLRVTDAETLDIARMVLVGKVNREIVSAINLHAPLAVGLSGEDAGFITAAEHDPALGFVGDVVAVDPALVVRLAGEGLVPVIATIGADESGQAYNINADTVAGAVAEALSAEKLIFLTDVAGVRSRREDPDSLVARLDAKSLDDLVANGAVGEGMIPKVQACSHAVRNGVGSAHVLDGRLPHVLLLELLSDEGIGTMVTAS